jgi:hypothetical protein
MLEYKGYKFDGESIPMYMEGCESVGTVYNGRTASLYFRGHAHQGKDIEDDEGSRGARVGAGAAVG